MEAIRRSKISSLFLLIGVSTGIMIIVIIQFPLEWMLYLLSNIFLLTFSLLLENKKRYFQLLLILSMSVGRPFWIRQPFAIHLGGAQNVPEFFMSDIWLFMLFIILWLELRSKSGFKLQRIDVACLMLLIWSIFSIINAQNYEFGFYELIRMIRPMLLYFYISRHIKSEEDVKFIIQCLMIALLLQSLLAIYQYVGGQLPFGFFNEVDYEESTTGAHRVGGTLFGCTTLSEFLQLLLPISLSMIYWKNDKWFYLNGLIFILGTVALIFTFTRGGILSLAMSIIVVMFIIHLTQRTERVIFISGLLVAVIGFIFVFFRNDILLRFTAYDGGSAMARIPMIKVALSIVAKNPILGIGLNNYADVMGYYGMYLLLPKQVDAVHNVYMLYGSEIGIPGLIILVFILGSAYQYALHILRRAQGRLGHYTIGMIAGMTGYLMISANISMGFKYLVPIANLIWLQIGLITSINNLQNQNESERK